MEGLVLGIVGVKMRITSSHMYVPGLRNSGPAYPETEKYELNTFGHNE